MSRSQKDRPSPGGRDQLLCDSMGGTVEDGIGFSDFDDAPCIHDGDAITEIAGNGQIVSDEQHGQPVLGAEAIEQVENPGLNGHVQRGRWLVAHKQAGLAGKCPSDADSLPLATGKLMRPAIGCIRLKTDGAQQLLNPVIELRLCDSFMYRDGLGNELAHAHSSIQRTGWILKHHLHVPAKPPQGFALQGCQISFIDFDNTACWLHEAQCRSGAGCLAASGTTDQSDGLSRVHAQRNPVQDAPASASTGLGQINDEVADIKRRTHSGLCPSVTRSVCFDPEM